MTAAAPAIGDSLEEEDIIVAPPEKTLSEKVREGVVDWTVWLFPAFSWVPTMTRDTLVRDIVGGLVIGVVFIPNVIAYAAIVDAPLISCLISASIFSFSYFLTGETPALSMGPTAEVNLMLSSVPNLPTDKDERFLVFQSIALQVGILGLFVALFDGGLIIRNSFAKAVGDAFACAAGIIICLQQLKTIFNLHAPASVLVHEIIAFFAEACREEFSVNSIYSALFFLGLFAYLIAMRKLTLPLPSWFPHQIVVVIVAILVTWLADLNRRIGLKIVKDVPVKPYAPIVPPMDTATLSNTFVTSIVVMLVGFLQMYSIATKVNPQEVKANKELVSLGLMSFFAGFFGGMPGSSSFSRCAILQELRVSTPLCHFFGASVVAVAMAVLFRLGVFYYLPSIATSAILGSAVLKLVDFTHAKYLFFNFKLDFLVWLVTWALVMFAGVSIGILTGIGLSIVIVLFKIARPPAHAVGYEPSKHRYIPLSMDREVLVYPGILIWQFESPFYFITINNFSSMLSESYGEENRPIHAVVVNCSRVTNIDATSVQLLIWQIANLEQRLKVKILLAKVTPEIRLALTSWMDHPLDANVIFDSVGLAVRAAAAHVREAAPRMNPDAAVPASSIPRKKDFRAIREEGHVASGHDLAGVIGIVCHTDRTPKQKVRVTVTDEATLAAMFGHLALGQAEGDGDEIQLSRTDARLKAIAAFCADRVGGIAHAESPIPLTARSSDEDEDLIVMYKLLTEAEGIHASKVKVTPRFRHGRCVEAVVVCKFGGSITWIGERQATLFARTIARRLGYHLQHFQVTTSSASQERVKQTAELVVAELRRTSGFAAPEPVTDDDTLLEKPLHESKLLGERLRPEICKILCETSASVTQRYLHLTGMREMLAQQRVDAPSIALTRLDNCLQEVCEKLRVAPTAANTPLTGGEPLSFLRRRYRALLRQFRNSHHNPALMSASSHAALQLSASHNNPVLLLPASDANALHPSASRNVSLHLSATHSSIDEPPYNVTTIPTIFDAVAYDLVENSAALHKTLDIDLCALFVLSKALSVVVRAATMGLTPSDKFIAGAVVLEPLFACLEREIERTCEPPRVASPATDDAAAIHHEPATATTTTPASPQAHKAIVGDPHPMHLYFSSAHMIDALRAVLLHSNSLQLPRDALEPLVAAELKGWHYMTHCFFKVFRSAAPAAASDPFPPPPELTADPVPFEAPNWPTEHRHYVEIYAASGASLLTDATWMTQRVVPTTAALEGGRPTEADASSSSEGSPAMLRHSLTMTASAFEIFSRAGADADEHQGDLQNAPVPRDHTQPPPSNGPASSPTTTTLQSATTDDNIPSVVVRSAKVAPMSRIATLTFPQLHALVAEIRDAASTVLGDGRHHPKTDNDLGEHTTTLRTAPPA